MASELKRVTANMRAGDIAAIEQLAELWDTTLTETLSRAVRLAAHIEELRAGGSLRILQPDGTVETVRFL